MQWTRYLKFGIPIVVGIAGTALLLNGVKPPEKSASLLELKAVKYLVVQPEEVFSEMSISGTIEASDKWSAVAQVKGEIYRSNDSIVEGLWVNAGDVILKIDPLDYELAISQISAELSGIEFELSLLNAEAENTQRILDLEQRQLAYAKADLDRIQKLYASGSATRKQLDDVQRATLTSEKIVTDINNGLLLVEPKKQKLLAQKQVLRISLDRAHRDLARTDIIAPYPLRISKLLVEDYQAVNVGQPLIEGIGVNSADVTAQVNIDKFRDLIGLNTPPSTLNNEFVTQTLNQLVSAEVRTVGSVSESWKAEIISVRTELDNRARTLQIVVRVDDPYSSLSAAQNFPLLPNQPIELVFRAVQPSSVITIPLSAVHQDQVLLLNKDNEIEFRDVQLGLMQENHVTITRGLEAGDKLILDSLIAAIPGQKFTGIEVAK
jgi:hypothetical protein